MRTACDKFYEFLERLSQPVRSYQREVESAFAARMFVGVEVTNGQLLVVQGSEQW